MLVFVIIIPICIFYILYNGNEGGGGTRGHTSYTYIVTPPLPDNHSKITLFFKEYKAPFKRKPTGLEFVIKLDN